MSDNRIELLQGTLDMLILKVLSRNELHGYAIARRIQEISEDVLKVEEGSLYPALYRMEQKGWISSSWGLSDNNRRAKYYQLTALGKQQLEVEINSWQALSIAISKVMQTA
ncbi:MAG: PadR family transcriptional regulator [Blastocatellia bacterium]|nr:PadR family transcriptional regulator [Blastocatellia bacterium]MBL8193966.1 PadR family transcriptional regulator [Blastocatellia bacterium]MBN8722448.1 PadR family transcriptional regulator [Acidobacteriota bacterium]